MTVLDLGAQRKILKGQVSAWWLFGSHARGDAQDDSDVDLLHVSPTPMLPYHNGAAQVTVYTESQLRRMASVGSLFVYHLVSEAKVGEDETGLLEDLRTTFRRPRNYNSLRSEVWSASVLLDASEDEFGRSVTSYASTARYLLRSYVYSILADRGDLSFSWREAASRLPDRRLLDFPREAGRWTFHDFVRVREILWGYCGAKARRGESSLESILPALSLRASLGTVLALRILTEGQSLLEYETLDLGGLQDALRG